MQGRPPDTWSHGELREDGTVEVPFDFFWADLHALPRLADHGDKIGLLIESMSL